MSTYEFCTYQRGFRIPGGLGHNGGDRALRDVRSDCLEAKDEPDGAAREEYGCGESYCRVQQTERVRRNPQFNLQ